MKRTSIFISGTALLHLLVIDLIFFVVQIETAVDFIPVSIYNVVWLLIALTILSHNYDESKNSQQNPRT